MEEKLSNVSEFLSISDADMLDPHNDLLDLGMHIQGRIINLLRNDHEEELEFWERYLDIIQRWLQTNKCQDLKDYDVFFSIELVHALIANCLVELNRFDEALVHLNQFLSKFFFHQSDVKTSNNNVGSITKNPEKEVDHNFAIWDTIIEHLIAGGIWFKMKNFEKSLYHLQVSFGLELSLERDVSLYTVYFNGIGSCLAEMNQYEHALVYFKQAIKLIQDDLYDDDEYRTKDSKFKIYMLPEVFQGPASFLNLNNCLLKLQKFEEAFRNLNKAVELSANWELINWQTEKFTTSLKKTGMKTLAKILYELGLWYKKQNYFKEAITYFQNSLSIHQKLNEAKKISSKFSELLHSHMQMYQRERVEKFLKSLYQSNNFVDTVAMVPTSILVVDDALSYHSKVGHGFLKMKHYKKALEFLKTALGIAMSKEFLGNDVHSILLYNSIGICLINLGEYEQSLNYFKLAKEMLENFKNDKRFEEEFWALTLHFAMSFHDVGKCFKELDQFEEALTYLDVAFEIMTNHYGVANDNDEVLAYFSAISASHLKIFWEQQSVLFDIGLCHMQQNRYKKAKTCFRQYLSICNKLPKADKNIVNAARLKLLTCYMKMYQRERVEKHLNSLYKSGNEVIVSMVATYSAEVDNTVQFGSYFKIGCALLKKQQYDRSLSFLKFSLGSTLSRDFDGCHLTTQIKLYSGIGTCLINLEQYEEAVSYFKLALHLIDKRIMTDDDYSSTPVFNLTSTFHIFGKCLMKLGQFEKALQFLNETLELVTESNVEEVHDLFLIGLAEKFPSYAKRPQELANVLCDLATCYMKQNSFKKAVSFFQRSFNLLKKLSKSENVATIRAKLLACRMAVYQRERVEKYLKDLHMCKSFETSLRMVDTQTLTYSIYIEHTLTA